MPRTTPFALAAILTLAIAGCSSTPSGTIEDPGTDVPTSVAPSQPDTEEPPAAAESDIDACALLAGIDVSALLAEEAGEPARTGAVCKVKPADTASPASIVVQAVTSGGGSSYANQKRLLGVDAEVAGLGDEAFQSGKRIDVLSGDRHLIFQVVRNPVGGFGQLDDAALVAAATAAFANTGW